MSTPSASNTSAAPHLLDAPRLPCFATGTPAADAIIAAVVEMLKECDPSPPVPTISSASTSCKSLMHAFLIPAADAVISSIVSPFNASMDKYAPICTGSASPFIISVMTLSAVW